jgi:hypothetical protein
VKYDEEEIGQYIEALFAERDPAHQPWRDHVHQAVQDALQQVLPPPEDRDSRAAAPGEAADYLYNEAYLPLEHPLAGRQSSAAAGSCALPAGQPQSQGCLDQLAAAVVASVLGLIGLAALIALLQ